MSATAPTSATLSCVVCGCTDADCSGCIRRTGARCSWVRGYPHPVCSACKDIYLRAVDAAVEDDGESIESNLVWLRRDAGIGMIPSPANVFDLGPVLAQLEQRANTVTLEALASDEEALANAMVACLSGRFDLTAIDWAHVALAGLHRIAGYREVIDRLTTRPATNDTDTSKAAAGDTAPRVNATRARILTALEASSQWSLTASGLTCDEMANDLGLRAQTASARCNELHRTGWIIDSGRRRKTSSGSLARVYTITAEGRRVLDGYRRSRATSTNN